MKTQLIAFISLLAATPALASLNTAETTPLDIAPQPASYQREPAALPDFKCGKPQRMMFILRDPSGAIVAMGVAEVPATC